MATKIVKGRIEFVNDTKVCVAGESIKTPLATMLNLLGVCPFQRRIEPLWIFENGEMIPVKAYMSPIL